MVDAPRDPRVLVIGYGSTLHSDDGVGPRVAETVAHWRTPRVAALSVTQLTPELAGAVSRVRDVYFVDAALPEAYAGGAAFHVAPLDALEPGVAASADMHLCDPRTVLALSQALYGATPRAWLISIPGRNLDLGETLSAQSHHGMVEVLAYLRERIGGGD